MSRGAITGRPTDPVIWESRLWCARAHSRRDESTPWFLFDVIPGEQVMEFRLYSWRPGREPISVRVEEGRVEGLYGAHHRGAPDDKTRGRDISAATVEVIDYTIRVQLGEVVLLVLESPRDHACIQLVDLLHMAIRAVPSTYSDVSRTSPSDASTYWWTLDREGRSLGMTSMRTVDAGRAYDAAEVCTIQTLNSRGYYGSGSPTRNLALHHRRSGVEHAVVACAADVEHRGGDREVWLPAGDVMRNMADRGVCFEEWLTRKIEPTRGIHPRACPDPAWALWRMGFSPRESDPAPLHMIELYHGNHRVGRWFRYMPVLRHASSYISHIPLETLSRWVSRELPEEVRHQSPGRQMFGIRVRVATEDEGREFLSSFAAQMSPTDTLWAVVQAGVYDPSDGDIVENLAAAREEAS